METSGTTDRLTRAVTSFSPTALRRRRFASPASGSPAAERVAVGPWHEGSLGDGMHKLILVVDGQVDVEGGSGGWLVLPNHLILIPAAHASGSSMPWEAPLQSILESIQGPVAKIVAVMIIIATGLALAFGDTSGGARRMVQIVFGLSIAFAASSFFLSFFSFGGGALV